MLDGFFLILNGIIPWHKIQPSASNGVSWTIDDSFHLKTAEQLMEWKLIEGYKVHTKSNGYFTSLVQNGFEYWRWWKLIRMNTNTSFAIFMSVSAAIPGSTEFWIHTANAFLHSKLNVKHFSFFFFFCFSPSTYGVYRHFVYCFWSCSYSMNPNSLETIRLCISRAASVSVYECFPVLTPCQIHSNACVINGWCCFHSNQL